MSKIDNRFLVVVGIVVVVLLLVFVFKNSNPVGKVIDEDKNTNALNPSFYEEDSCRCLEHGIPKCLEGFVYNKTRELCVNSEEKTVTYATLSCSKYECAGKTYEYNFEIEDWEELE